MPEETIEQPKEQEQPKEPQKEQAVPYERFKEVNEKNKELLFRLTALETAQKKAEEQKAKEAGEYKDLYEKLQTELATEKRSNTILKIASSKGLPAALVNRVQGSTEDEINADVESLLELVKEKTNGVTPPPRGGNGNTFDFASASPQQVREHLAKQAAA